jgi:glycosyltransferase involved in cell wall biosynthesis
MKIGIAGPVLTEPFAEYLGQDIRTAPKGLGGISIIQLVKALLRRGHNVSVYSLDEGVTSSVVLGRDPLRIYYGPYRSRHRMRDFMKMERQSIRDFVIADNPDIVNAHWTYEFALGSLAARKKVIVTVRDWAPTVLRHSPNPYRFGRALMHFTTILRSPYLSANSPHIQKRIQRYIRRDIPVVPNFLDDADFNHGQRQLNVEQPRIVSLSNGFGKLKNVQQLLIAFGLIRHKLPTCRLALIGQDFESGGKAEQWARTNALAEGVDFIGYMEHSEAVTYLEMGDVLIHPSLEESFGMAVLESMAKGTPVIGGNSSGAIPWILNHGEAGILTDVSSPERIADEAVGLLAHPGSWEHYSTAGHRYARENFNSSKVVDQYIELYHQVLDSAGEKRLIT